MCARTSAPSPLRPSCAPRRRSTACIAALGVAVALAAGCSAGDVDPAGSDAAGSPTDAAGAPDGAGGPPSDAPAAAEDTPGEPVPEVEIDGDDLVLHLGDGPVVVATVTDADLVHATVRPGYDHPVTLLVLTRDPERFELRYLDVVDGEASDLFGFPFRMQVDPDAATIADVPPVPVWSPDGARVAWLEWTPDGTRLRTLGWRTFEARSNPSDDRADWDLGEVPVGTQLAGWEVDDDGTPVLVSRLAAGERWRIRLEDGGPIAAAGPDARS